MGRHAAIIVLLLFIGVASAVWIWNKKPDQGTASQPPSYMDLPNTERNDTYDKITRIARANVEWPQSYCPHSWNRVYRFKCSGMEGSSEDFLVNEPRKQGPKIRVAMDGETPCPTGQKLIVYRSAFGSRDPGFLPVLVRNKDNTDFYNGTDPVFWDQVSTCVGPSESYNPPPRKVRDDAKVFFAMTPRNQCLTVENKTALELDPHLPKVVVRPCPSEPEWTVRYHEHRDPNTMRSTIFSTFRHKSTGDSMCMNFQISPFNAEMRPCPKDGIASHEQAFRFFNNKIQFASYMNYDPYERYQGDYCLYNDNGNGTFSRCRDFTDQGFNRGQVVYASRR